MPSRTLKLAVTLALAACLGACASKSGPRAADSADSPVGAILLAGSIEAVNSGPIMDEVTRYVGTGKFGSIIRENGRDTTALLKDSTQALLESADSEGCAFASDETTAGWIASASCVGLGADEPLAIGGCLTNEQGSPVFTKLVDAHRSGIAIVAAGGAASDMGANVIAGGASAEALAKGPAKDGAFRVEPGLGLIEGLLVDVGAMSHGNLGRTLAAMEAADVTMALALDDQSGVLLDLNRQRLTVVGTAPVFILDSSEASMKTSRFENVRLTMLSQGDAFALDKRSLRFASGRDSYATKSVAGQPEAPDAWAPNALVPLLEGLAESDAGVQFRALSGTTHRLVLSRDPGTLIFKSRLPGGDANNEPPTYTLKDVKLDFLPVE